MTEIIRKTQRRLLDMAISIRDILEGNGIPYFITYGTLLGAVRHKGFIPWDDDFDYYIFDEDYYDAIEILRNKLPSNYFLEDKNSEPLYFHGWAHVKDLKSETECELFPADGHYLHKGISVDLYRAYYMPESKEKIFRICEHIEYLKRKMKVNLISEIEYRERISKLELEYKIESQTLRNHKSSIRERMIYTFPTPYDDRIFEEEMFPLKDYNFEGERFKGPNDADKFLKRCYGNYMELPSIEKRKPHYRAVKFFE